MKSKKENFWIIQRHTNNMHLLIKLCEKLLQEQGKIIDEAKIRIISEQFIDESIYNPRKGEISLTTLRAKINQLCFFMFGFKNSNKKQFIFSPLGKMYVNRFKNETERNLIFLSLLFILQYPHPYSKTNEQFKLFPFRLIFKLLRDDKLDKFLYNYEIFMFITKVKNNTGQDYEYLINELIYYRKNYDKIKNKLKNESEVFVVPMYEWDYYTKEILLFHNVIVLSIVDNNEKIELFHITKNTYSKPTKRIFTRKKIKINSLFNKFIDDLLLEMPWNQKIISFNDPNNLLIDSIRNIYSKVPKILLKEISWKESDASKSFNIPKLIIEYANNQNNTSELFEKILEDALNIFNDVDARRIGGPGNTDIECIFIKANKNRKFNVEAKATRKKLTQINSGRLKTHMKKTGAEYCIVITPNFTPGASSDIINEKIVILTSSSLSEYILQNLIYGNRNFSFKNLNAIIRSNFGNDISEKIYDEIFNKFGNKISS